MSRQFVFGATPTVSMRRSKFNLSHGLKTSMSIGYLYPIDCTEVVPGDTFKMKTTQVCRVSTAFLRPVMDNCFMDVYYFFVPSRLCYDKWDKVFGDDKPSAYVTPQPAVVPHSEKVQTIKSKTVADYLGLPLGIVPPGINLLPFRAFALIYNEWFRNESIIDPVHVQLGDLNGTTEDFNENPWSPNNYTGRLPRVGKKKDYFTSCLPSPQKGPAVSLSLGDRANLVLPMAYNYEGTNRRILPVYGDPKFSDTSVYIRDNGETQGFVGFGRNENGSSYDTLRYVTQSSVPAFGKNVKVQFGVPLDGSGDDKAYVDLSTATATNVNDLRMAFALQKMLETDARYGTRYREYILGHFGVTNADARMQIPEFLGGKRMPIKVQAVAQTNTQDKDAEGAIESPLASLGAYSHTVGGSRFSKSFSEHGFVIAVACIRQLHTYQQGIDRMWFRNVREDFYDPKFANIGEQPVYKTELFGIGGGSSAPTLKEGPVFGYNEAWADYRYKPSKITGEMRTGAKNSFDVYHFGDFYLNPPTLSKDFVEETGQFFDRTVAAPASSVDHFIVDFWFDFTAYRVMPVYSVPGLIDHH